MSHGVRQNENGQEFWYARELQAALEYSQWRRFSEAIERAKTACEQSGNDPYEHFADVGKMFIRVRCRKNNRSCFLIYEIATIR